MSHKDSIENMHGIAREKGGKCLSELYVDQKTELRWQCAEGHIWSATPGMIKGSRNKSGTWCKICGIRSSARKRMHSLQDMHRLADDPNNLNNHKGGAFASPKYLGSNVKHRWRCQRYPVHPEFQMIPNAVQQGQWCPRCAGAAKPTFDEINELARAKHPSARCLSTTYTNSSTDLEWHCGVDGHPPFPKSYTSVKHDGGWCKLCRKERLRPTKFDRDFLSRLAKSAGGTLISEEHYKSTKQIHRWKCVDGHEFNRSLGHIFSSRSFCPQCSNYGGIREQSIRDLFVHIFGQSFERSRNLPWLINEAGNAMELDGYNAELGLAFEHNGQQHYELDGFYSRQQHQLNRRINDDSKKAQLCKENKVTLIIIPFTVPIVEIQNFVLDELRSGGITPPVTETFQPGLVRSSILEKLQQHAASLGGRLLSDKYLGSDKKLLWQCENVKHAPFGSSPSTVKAGSWCDKCADVKASESHKVSAEQVREWARLCDGELELDSTHESTKFALSDEAQFRCLSCDRTSVRTVRQVKGGYLCFCRTNKIRISRAMIEERLSERRIRLIAPDRIEGGKTRITIQCEKCKMEWPSKAATIMSSGAKCPACNPARNAGITIEKARAIAEKIGFKLLSEDLENGSTELSWECKTCADRLNKPFREMRNVRRCRNCAQIEIAGRWKIK